jgi:DGQHR domain-containing protein
MRKLRVINWVKVPALAGRVLGVDVYRGYAPLSFLARISRADIYDKSKNPLGTQRDLSPKHAKDAYEYVVKSTKAFWPEVLLCLRDPKVAKFDSVGENASNPRCGFLKIDEAACVQSNKISISRVDGNHRLHYADGLVAGFPAVDKNVSFCLAYGVDLAEEIALFRDINNNQKRMNTSHLDNITARLTGEDRLKATKPALYIAKKLAEDSNSPFFKKVYDGGIKSNGLFGIPLATLKSGIGYMLSRPTRLTALPDVDAQYKVMRNFFNAVKMWQPNAWEEPKRYLLLRGAGLWGVCFIGSFVIDRVLSKNSFDAEAMLRLLRSGRQWDWGVGGDFVGLSGRGGAVRISDLVTKELSTEGDLSTEQLFKKIMSS